MKQHLIFNFLADKLLLLFLTFITYLSLFLNLAFAQRMSTDSLQRELLSDPYVTYYCDDTVGAKYTNCRKDSIRMPYKDSRYPQCKLVAKCVKWICDNGAGSYEIFIKVYQIEAGIDSSTANHDSTDDLVCDKLVRDVNNVTELTKKIYNSGTNGYDSIMMNNILIDYWKYFKSLRDTAFEGAVKSLFKNGLDGNRALSPEQFKQRYSCNNGNKEVFFRNVQGECMQTIVSKDVAFDGDGIERNELSQTGGEISPRIKPQVKTIKYNGCSNFCCKDEISVCYDSTAPDGIKIIRKINQGANGKNWLTSRCIPPQKTPVYDPKKETVLPCVNWCVPYVEPVKQLLDGKEKKQKFSEIDIKHQK